MSYRRNNFDTSIQVFSVTFPSINRISVNRLRYLSIAYEPDETGGFLPDIRMVDSPNEPNTVVDNWWTAFTETSPALYLHHLATQVSASLMIAE